MKKHLIAFLAAALLAVASYVLADEVPSPRADATARPGSGFGILDFGASPSSADNTAAMQAAINACQKVGGGVVEIPAGVFRFRGTLNLTSNRVWLRGMGRGATTLVFDNGAADCIVVGNVMPEKPPVAAAQRSSNRITDVNIVHGLKSAGRTVAVINHADFIVEKVTIDHCVVGVYANRINNVVLRDVVIIPDNKGASNQPDLPWSSWVGVWWDTVPNPEDATSRSDVLMFDNVCINCNAAPGTGVLWDGMTNTFLISYANILNGAYGFRVINSRQNKHYLVPQFLNASSLLIENAGIDLSIETGAEFKITGSDLDMCKENTVQILPDLAGSPTDCVLITNSRIGNCQKTGLVIDAKDVKISNSQMFSTSLAGRGRYPVIEIGPHARDVSISEVCAEEHIGTRNASYGVSITPGATNIQIDNLDASRVTKGAIENQGAAKLMIGKVIEPGSGDPSGLYGEGKGMGWFAQRSADPVRFISKNRAVGPTVASIGASTGSDQAYLEIAMNDNSGKPFATYRYGKSVTSASENVADRIFASQTGAERVRIGAEGFKTSVPCVDGATSFVIPTEGGVITATATTSRLVLSPPAAIASQTIVAPASPANGQLFYVSAVAQPVSGLQWRGSVVGAPVSIPGGHTTILQFCAATGQWLCVQE
jgi:hypothetical protein